MKVKKIFRIALGSLLLASVFSPVKAFSQKGEKSLGVMGGYATYNDGGFANVNFQYSVADHIRIAPSVGYVFRNDQKSAFTLSADVQFPFRIVKAFNVYPLVGITFNNWNYTYRDDRSRVGADFGGGFDLYLTSYLKMSIEGKYSLMNDTSGGYIGFGMAYVF